MLPGWIEDRMSLFINEEQIYNQDLRLKFETWMYDMKYTLPKTERECDFRINEFMKDNNIGHKVLRSGSSVKVIDMNHITNKVAYKKLS